MNDPIDLVMRLMDKLKRKGLDDKSSELFEAFYAVWEKAVGLPGVSPANPDYEKTEQGIFLKNEVEKLILKYQEK